MVPNARRYDAVGRMAWAMHSLFKGWGAESLVFTERQASPLGLGPLRKGLLDRLPAWGGRAAPDVSVYQHSIGSPVAERFLEWPAAKKVLIYQNITPSEVAGLSEAARRDQDWGRAQLRDLIAGSHLQIALSEYSCRELSDLGAKRILKLPYLGWKREIRPGPSRRSGPNILVVARVVPHKGIREAVLAFSSLRRRHPHATLTILGNLRGDKAYVRLVRETIRAEGLAGAVRMKGRVSDRNLTRHYRTASALLSLSEHEGFCVPIVEAMQARTPVVALSAAAVPETMGTAGILLERKDPELAAEALHRVLSDETLRQTLWRAQESEEKRFSRAAFAGPFAEALASLK